MTRYTGIFDANLGNVKTTGTINSHAITNLSSRGVSSHEFYDGEAGVPENDSSRERRTEYFQTVLDWSPWCWSPRNPKKAVRIHATRIRLRTYSYKSYGWDGSLYLYILKVTFWLILRLCFKGLDLYWLKNGNNLPFFLFCFLW